MNKTAIEWVRGANGSQGYTWNPITGCLNRCPYCYARRLAEGRLRQAYLGGKYELAPSLSGGKVIINTDPFYPRFWADRLGQIPMLGSTSSLGIFVCDMGDLFGAGIPMGWTKRVLDILGGHWQHRFYLLTKQPQNLLRFSPFPDNAWVGVTATGREMFEEALDKLKVTDATLKYISIEPLLEAIPFNMERLAYCGVKWLIIGAMTGRKAKIEELAQQYPQLTPMPYGKIWTLQPQPVWVKEIVSAATKVGIPVFLKNNLKPLIASVLFPGLSRDAVHRTSGFDAIAFLSLRQEMPNTERCYESEWPASILS